MMLLAQQVESARAAGALLGSLCILGVIVLVGTLIGGAFLMGACKLFNTMVYKPASRNGVPMPDVSKAMGIIFATMIVNVAVTFGAAFAIGTGTAVLGGDRGSVDISIQVFSNTVSFFVLSGMLTAMLPTHFGRAALVSLLYYALAIIPAVLILLVAMTVLGNLPGAAG